VAAQNHNHHNLGGSNRILNLASAAAVLDMDPVKLRKGWRSWGIPAYKTGRELRFIERDLRAWLMNRPAA
jgi:hypothetical protein